MGDGMMARTLTDMASNFVDTCISKSVYGSKVVGRTYARMQDVNSACIRSTSSFGTDSLSSRKTRADTKEINDNRMLQTGWKLDAC